VKIVLHNFRVVDENTDIRGTVVVEDGLIREILPWEGPGGGRPEAGLFIDGPGLLGPAAAGRVPVLLPALVDLHAHFRDPGSPEPETRLPSETGLPSETLESACLAAAAGGYGTVVCMANTKPPVDTPEKARSLRERAAALGLIDLYPVLSLTKNMDGRELSGITALTPETNSSTPLQPPPRTAALSGAPAVSSVSSEHAPVCRTGRPPSSFIRMLSEDGRDVADDALFLAAMGEARRLGLPVSCHCDAGGPEAAEAKAAGKARAVWSRIEENNAVRRAIALGEQAGCHIHIAHVSTRESAELIRQAKKKLGGRTPNAARGSVLRDWSGMAGAPEKDAVRSKGRRGVEEGGAESGNTAAGFFLTCEAAPHHIACTEAEAQALGDETWGRVNPPLREEADRRAVMEALRNGTIDAIATDHAPHSAADKERGAPGFTGLETAFSVCLTELVRGRAGAGGVLDLRRLSSLMSATPARILGLGGTGPWGRGRIAPGLRADLFIADIEAAGTVNAALFKSRGKNSPFAGRELRGTILLTLHGGRIVFGGNGGS
jgi:dihydroorotase